MNFVNYPLGYFDKLKKLVKAVKFREDRELYWDFIKSSTKAIAIIITKIIIYFLRKIFGNFIKLILHIRIYILYFSRRMRYRIRVSWLPAIRWTYCHSVFFEFSHHLQIKRRTKLLFSIAFYILLSPIWIPKRFFAWIFKVFVRGTSLHLACVHKHFIVWTVYLLPQYPKLRKIYGRLAYAVFYTKYRIKCLFLTFKRTFFKLLYNIITYYSLGLRFLILNK